MDEALDRLTKLLIEISFDNRDILAKLLPTHFDSETFVVEYLPSSDPLCADARVKKWRDRGARR